MGSALVKTFAKQNYPTYVWNRTRSRAEALMQHGAQAADTLIEALQAAEVVIVNVDNYETSKQLLQTGDAARRLRGKFLIQLTTGTPKQSRELAAWALSQGIAYLDGAIMVTPDLVGTPECKILYSGPTATFERCRPVLEALGGNLVYLGENYGHASTLDSALLAYFWAGNFGVHQAIQLCQADSLPLETLRESLTGMTAFVGHNAADLVRRVQTRNFTADLATLAICHQSVRLIIQQCEDAGVNHSVMDAFDALFQKAGDAGHNADDFAVLNNFYQLPGAAEQRAAGAEVQ